MLNTIEDTIGKMHVKPDPSMRIIPGHRLIGVNRPSSQDIPPSIARLNPATIIQRPMVSKLCIKRPVL